MEKTRQPVPGNTTEQGRRRFLLAAGTLLLLPLEMPFCRVAAAASYVQSIAALKIGRCCRDNGPPSLCALRPAGER